jgi:endonuclease III
MVSAKQSILNVINQLAKHYGEPAPPTIVDPLQMILWENVAYLLGDSKREFAYAELKRRIGLSPKSILAASQQDLLEVATLGGMRPHDRAEKLLTIAQLAIQEMPKGTKVFLGQPVSRVRQALKKFPGIGDPGADRIMLFSGVEVVPTFDSNGLRVLQRLGFVAEDKNYSLSYREAQKVAKKCLPLDAQHYIRSYQLMQQHGRETCKNNAPKCYACPFESWCEYRQKQTPNGSSTISCEFK